MHNVFITGASGCIGHYVVEALGTVPGMHLYLLVRDRQKFLLPAPPDRITLIEGDLNHIQDQAPLLERMNSVVHLAAAWGDPDRTRQVNVEQTQTLFELLNPDYCRRILYFSTASLLDRQHQPIPIAGRDGTDYIRTKYDMLQRRSELKLYDRLITLYPTLVFGGSDHHPFSQVTKGLPEVSAWLNWVRFVRVDGSFHFIHAADIAAIVRYLLDPPVHAPAPPRDLVLGTAPILADDCVAELCRFYQKRLFFRVPLPIRLLQAIARLFGAQFSAWDTYCLQNRHFVYDAVEPATFDLPTTYPTLKSLLSTYG